MLKFLGAFILRPSIVIRVVRLLFLWVAIFSLPRNNRSRVLHSVTPLKAFIARPGPAGAISKGALQLLDIGGLSRCQVAESDCPSHQHLSPWPIEFSERRKLKCTGAPTPSRLVPQL